MKNVDAAVSNAIRSAYDIKALPRLTAEWNMNRYHEAVVTNNPSEDVAGNDVDMFPIESIVEPIRPSKGINKARVNYGTIADSYQTPSMPRYYIASLEDKYKYWISPYASDGNGAITGVAPQVIYNETVKTNKIVVGVENTWASPVTWSIQTTTDGGATWATASSAPAIGNDGRAVLYWNGASWSSTRPATMPAGVAINGVRVLVSRLGGGIGLNGQPTQAQTRFGLATTSGAGSYFSLIEISARYEMDLTDYLEEVSDTFDGGDASLLTPVGTITSNSADLSLWDGDRVLSSQLEELMEPNVKMNLEYIYHINDSTYTVQEFSMFVDSWKPDDESSISVQLSDASKYLNEIYPKEAKYENQTVAQIIYRLLDSVGFTDYNVINYAYLNDFKIPVFWTDGSQTVWEILDELATATQTLIYFDAWGRLNVKTRERAFDPNRPVDWTLRAQDSGSELADIVSLEQNAEYSANLIKVKFKKTAWADEVNGHVQMTTVWSPEDTVVLRSTPLLSAMDANSTTFVISPSEAAHWPFEGAVQIEGEFIGYKGKLFNYFDNGWKNAWVNDEKEYDEYNERTPSNMRHHNHFPGIIRVDERGAWNTEAVTHVPEAKGWNGVRFNYTGTTGTWWNSTSCVQWLRGASILRLQSNGELPTLNHFARATRAGGETSWKTIGTRFRFNGAAQHQRGGIVFNCGNDGNGYYIECRPTNTIENKDRDIEDEISIYSIHGVSVKKMKANYRTPSLIVADTWHDLEISYDQNAQAITVWLDGKRIFREVIDPPNYRHAPNGEFGMFIRGQTSMDFEYIYALNRATPSLPDDASFLNRITGAYQGDTWSREYVYSTRTKTRWVKRKNGKGKRKKNVKFRKNLQFFDEFGPYVHEVREFDVKFDPAPTQNSKLYFSNDWQVVCPEFRADSFGAYFILANASRTNAVVSGSDDLSFAAAGASVEQQLLVYGRALTIGEDEEVEVRNESQIRSRGEIVAEIDSPWIQSEHAAQAVADWIAAHWSKGADQLEVEVFGNPLFELGDVVAVEHPEKGYSAATHQYYVVGISTQFNSGVETTLTLRRKN